MLPYYGSYRKQTADSIARTNAGTAVLALKSLDSSAVVGVGGESMLAGIVGGAGAAVSLCAAAGDSVGEQPHCSCTKLVAISQEVPGSTKPAAPSCASC